MKYIKFGGLTILYTAVILLAGILIGRHVFFKTEIKVVEKEITKTEYKYKYLKPENKPVFDQDNFTRLLYCYDSPLLFKDHTKDNILSVTAYDECKEATAKYEIKSKSDLKVYFTIGIAGVGTGLILYHILK